MARQQPHQIAINDAVKKQAAQQTALINLLEAFQIDPEKKLPDGNTAFGKIHAAVMAAHEEIEDDN